MSNEIQVGMHGFPQRIRDAVNREVEEYLYSINSHLKSIEIHSTIGRHTHDLGENGMTYIFLESLHRGSNVSINRGLEIDIVTIDGHTYNVEGSYEHKTEQEYRNDEKFYYLTSDDGKKYGTIDRQYDQINFFYSIEQLNSQDLSKLITTLLKELHLVKGYNITPESELSIEKMIEIIKNQESRMINEEIQRSKELVREYKNLIQDSKQSIINYAKSYDENMLRIARLEDDISQYDGKKLRKELEYISTHEKVDYITPRGRNGMLRVYTKELFTEDFDGNMWRLGRMIIDINLSQAKILFFSRDGQGGMGYWTENDPHPHVDGSNGTPCLGSVEAEIADLSYQKEYYALFLTAISFLEAVNREDSAGRKVVNWELVKKVTDDVEPHRTCDHCGEDYSREQMTDAISSSDEDIIICDHCADDNYQYHEGEGAYFSSDHPIWEEEEED